MERQCRANNHYSRRECLEISGISENVKIKDLESLTLQTFEKIYVNVDPAKAEYCHWVKTQCSKKKVVIKFSRRKDTNNIRAEKEAKG